MPNIRLSILVLVSMLFLYCKGGPESSVPEEDTPPQTLVSPDTTLPPTAAEPPKQPAMNYRLDQPDKTLNLAKKLMEISGLSYHTKSDQLLCVNDEKASIFFLNPENGKIENEIDFGKNADYEGIEIVGDIIYVVKSNGNIYPYDLKKEKDGEVIKTPLRQENDIEGLGYDSKSNRLLLACKGSPNLEEHEKLKKTKTVYAYDLNGEQFIEEPVLLIKDDELVEMVKAQYGNTGLSKKKLEKLEKRAKDISPSAVAVHPGSGHYYVLSTVGKVMAVYGKNKKLREVLMLDEDIHAQPEGICFAPDGTMYVSNEGRGLVARIHRFNKQ